MEELNSLSSTQQSVACALALQMVSGGEINIFDIVREKTAAAPLAQQKIASALDSAAGLLGALGSLSGSTATSLPFGKLPETALGTASKTLTDEKSLCRSFIRQQFGIAPSDLVFLGVSNPLLRGTEEDEQGDDAESKEASLTEVFSTNASRSALLAVLRYWALLDPGFKQSPDSTIGKVERTFG